MRILALDPGRRKTGVAISDDQMAVAVSLGVMANQDYLDLPDALFRFLAQYLERSRLPYTKPVKVTTLAEVIKQCEIGAILMGMPYGQGGQMTELTRELSDICTMLNQLARVPVIPVDERFSSRAANFLVKAMGIKGKKDKKSKMDEIVAVELLQGFIERNRALIMNFPPEMWMKDE